jgi:hypothetical protein
VNDSVNEKQILLTVENFFENQSSDVILETINNIVFTIKKYKEYFNIK